MVVLKKMLKVHSMSFRLGWLMVLLMLFFWILMGTLFHRMNKQLLKHFWQREQTWIEESVKYAVARQLNGQYARLKQQLQEQHDYQGNWREARLLFGSNATIGLRERSGRWHFMDQPVKGQTLVEALKIKTADSGIDWRILKEASTPHMVAMCFPLENDQEELWVFVPFREVLVEVISPELMERLYDSESFVLEGTAVGNLQGLMTPATDHKQLEQLRFEWTPSHLDRSYDGLIFLFGIIVACCAGWLFYYISRRLVTFPLHTLIEKMGRDKGEKYDAIDLGPIQSLELQMVTSAVNTLFEMVNKRELEILAQHRFLENEVEQRRSAEARLVSQNKVLEGMNRDIKRQQEKLVEQAKMVLAGTLAGGVAHEVNNPLTVVSGNLTCMKKYLASLNDFVKSIMTQLEEKETLAVTDLETLKAQFDIDFIFEDTDELMADSEEAAQRVRSLVSTLSDFAHYDENRVSNCSLKEVVKKSVLLSWNKLKYKVELHRQVPEHIFVVVNEQLLAQVLTNTLIFIADLHIPRVKVNVIYEGSEEHGLELLSVQYESLEAIELKPLSAHSGQPLLGLDLAKEIMCRMGGWINSRVSGHKGRFILAMPKEHHEE